MAAPAEDGTAGLAGTPPRRVLCARHAHLGLIASLRRFPELRGEPVIVGGAPQLRLPVIAASRAALNAGVRPGQPLRQAQQLCPQAAFVPLDREAVDALRSTLCASLQRLTPSVEAGDEEVLCDLSGRHAVFAGEPGWAVAVAREVEAVLGEPPAAGVAGSRFVARMAAAVSDAGRIRRVRAGEEAAFLAPLPLEVLPASGQLTARLAAFGLDCLGEVAALAPADLLRQFGTEGLRIHRLARGHDDDGVHPALVPDTWCERLVFESATGDLEPLLHAVRRCAGRLGVRLAAAGMAADEAAVTLEPEGAEPVGATTRAAHPIAGAGDAWTAALGAMSGLVPPAPVMAVQVTLAGLQPARARQSDLLRPGDAARETVASAAGRLRARFGAGTVRRPALAPDPGDVPERRFAWRDPTAAGAGR